MELSGNPVQPHENLMEPHITFKPNFWTLLIMEISLKPHGNYIEPHGTY